LQAKQASPVEPIRGHANHKSDADIPHREGAGDHRHETFALVLADIAGSQSKLGSCQK
jgi:hypothetical protein